MGRMSEGERDPVKDRHGVQFIGTTCQQENAGGAAKVDGPGLSGIGRRLTTLLTTPV